MRKPGIMLTFCAASLAGCDGNDERDDERRATDSSDRQAVARLYACDEAGFVEQRPLQGRGFDRAQGGLLDPPRSSYVVFASQAYPRAGERALFRTFVGAIVAQFDSSDGALALAVGTDERCGVGRTLSIWEDEPALFGFASSGAHAEAMARGAEYFESFKTTYWPASAAELDALDWTSARRALDAVEPITYE